MSSEEKGYTIDSSLDLFQEINEDEHKVVNHGNQDIQFINELYNNKESISGKLNAITSVQELLKQPYKNRAYAISEKWDKLKELTTISGGQQQSNQESQSFKQSLNQMLIKLKEQYPQPILNFDLLILSPKYTQTMHELLNQDLSQIQQDKSRVSLFTDWRQMTLKPGAMEALKKQTVGSYNEEFNFPYTDIADTNDWDKDDPEIRLISDNCWRKITYTFGQLGPEIMFFCNKDPHLDAYVPDLEPVKVGICLFNENMQQLPHSDNDQVQVSKFISVSQLKNYLATSNTLLGIENTAPNSLTLILVDKEEKLENQLVQLTGPGNEGGSNLGLIDQQPNRKKLYDWGIRDGSTIAVIPFVGLNILTINDRNKKMREIFTRLGPIFQIDGSQVYEAQNHKYYGKDENTIAEYEEYQDHYAGDHWQAPQQTAQNSYQSLRVKNRNNNHQQNEYGMGSYDERGGNSNNANFVIRQRGSRAQGHDDYSAPRNNNNQEIPEEYAHDPDLYYAIQASLQLEGGPETQDNQQPTYDDDRNDDLDQNRDETYNNGGKQLNTSSTADGNKQFDISFESRNRKMDEIAMAEGEIGSHNQPRQAEREQPAAPRLTLEQERQEQIRIKRLETKDKFEAAKLKASAIFTQDNNEKQTNDSPLNEKMMRRKKLMSSKGNQFYQIQPLTKIAGLKNFSQLQINLNKLSVNIQEVGLDKALMKKGSQIEFEEEMNVKQKEEVKYSGPKGQKYASRFGSVLQQRNHQSSQLITKNRRQYYSPPSAMAKNQVRTDSFEYPEDEQDVDGKTFETKSGSVENKQGMKDNRGILEDILDEDIENYKIPGELELKADGKEYFNIKENNIERARRYTSSEVIKETNVVQGDQDYS